MKTLSNKKVAILAADGFEQSELEQPLNALREAGAEVSIISPADAPSIQGMNHMEKGKSVPVDLPLSQADSEDFDALMLPGGLYNPDTLRSDSQAVRFVQDFLQGGKPVAAICHGPWLLAETGLVKGRKITSWPAIKTDLRNAGADWVDQEVVVDQGIITSRCPDDLPAFNRKMIEEIAEGRHDRAAA